MYDVNAEIFTDRDLLIALLNAVGLLHERITGERFMLYVSNADGDTMPVYPSSASEWLEAAVAPSSLEGCSRPTSPSHKPNAIQTSPS